MNFPRVHDLLEVRPETRVVAEVAEQQAELDACLTSSRVVVTRRAPCVDGLVPVGVRGIQRNERYAGVLRLEDFAACYSPESLRGIAEEQTLPAFHALTMLRELWRDFAMPWGPVGSVGFALASGCESVNAGSDLDIVIHVEPEDISTEQMEGILRSLEGMPCRVDVLLETEAGAFALQEAVSGAAKILRRTSQGAELAMNPWVVAAVSDTLQQVCA